MRTPGNNEPADGESLDGSKIDGVVLAAGESRRMRRRKSALDVGGETFLARAILTLRGAGCRRVYVVVGADEVGAEMPTDEAVNVVVNERRGSEQVDSLRAALRRLPADSAGVLVLPVDVPLVRPETAASVVSAAARGGAGVIWVPVHGDVAGHPVLIGSALYGELLNEDMPEGVRTLMGRHAEGVREVPVDDAGILIDIDTPDDYRRFIGAE